MYCDLKNISLRPYHAALVVLQNKKGVWENHDLCLFQCRSVGGVRKNYISAAITSCFTVACRSNSPEEFKNISSLLLVKMKEF